MAIDAYVSTWVRASPDRCFEAAADFERYIHWARQVDRATILDREDDGFPRRVAYEASLFGKDYSATVDYDFGSAPTRLSWTLFEARKMHFMEGSFGFEPADGGTEMSFRLRIELVKPRPPRHERRAGRLVEVIMSRDLRRYIEREGRM